MKVKLFITSSIGLIGTWLTLAYTHQVDMDSYPRLGKDSLPLAGDLSAPVPEKPDTQPAETITVAQ